MSSHKNELLLETKYKMLDSIIMGTDEKEDESLSGSQNFCLKLSQDSVVSDNQDTNNDEDIIVISDSSSACSTPKHASRASSVSKKHPLINSNVFIVDCSDSGSVNTENKKYFQTWRAEAKSHFIDNYQNILKGNNISYTSDESSCNSIEQIKCVQKNTNSNKTSSSYISCTTENSMPKGNVNSHRNIYNEENLLSNNAISNRTNFKSSRTPSNSTCKSSNSSKSKSSNNNTSKSSNNTSKSSNNNCKNYLSRKDTKNIIKNIKSRRMVYESPKIRQENVQVDSEADDSIIHPAVSSTTNLKHSNIIINETLDSESDIIPASQSNIQDLYRTHMSKYFNVPNVEKNIETTCTELSENKKKQILQWLMVNSPESQSDGSFSVVSASNKDGRSSGNSSLERLEMNYETPNNREKMRQQHGIEKGIRTPGCTKVSLSTPLRQTTINEFVRETEDNAPVHSKLTKNNAKNNMFPTSAQSTTNVPQNIDITDCADILDKLYGKSWRDKADALFPKTEPRKVVSTKNRAVQTERKITRQERINISDSDDSNTSMKELNLNNQGSRKKVVQRSVKRRDSFITDQTSSESGCESSYHTALTNLRTSPNKLQTKQKALSIVQQLNILCDGETEDEDYEDNNQDRNIGRRKLSFNNSGSEDSSTSEFDPEDVVPPKPIVKKDTTKNTRQIYKLSTPSNVKYNKLQSEKHNSFLASLSESVPIANVHPEAKKYRLDYKNNKENLCNYLYKLYNEKVFDKELPEDMIIEWNVRMRGTAGYCYNKRSVKTLGGIVRSSRIVLATKILDTPDRLRDTLIHEMCHAAAWLINGVSDGHGPFWTTWASKAMKIFPELPPVRRCHDYKIKTKFTYKCVSCGYSIGRHSKSLDIEKKRCGHCYGKFELLINKTTKSGTVQMQTPKREPSAFALYVKENYNSVKKDRNIKHAEVMKILGQQFSAMKIAKKQENVNNSDTPD